MILAACAVVVVAALVILASAPIWARVVVAAVALPLLARAGRPAGKPIVTAATLSATVQAPDQDVITRALGNQANRHTGAWQCTTTGAASALPGSPSSSAATAARSEPGGRLARPMTDQWEPADTRPGGWAKGRRGLPRSRGGPPRSIRRDLSPHGATGANPPSVTPHARAAANRS